jgi:predicted helicase
MVSIFECTSSIDVFVKALKEKLGYSKSIKDPQGSCFQYLYPSQNSRPLAVGIFPDLDKADSEEEAKKIIFETKKLDKEIHKHWLDANLEEQPVLYLITGTSDNAPFVFIKPTSGSIRKKLTSIYTVEEKEKLESRLSLLSQQKLRQDSKALFDIPVIDVVFYDPITSSKELAQRLAEITREIEKTVVSVYEKEKPNGKIHQLLETFKTELIQDLKLHSSDPKEYGFSDLYAQTISYGMFSARCFKPDQEFTRKTIVDSIPPTNPFLKELFQSISQDDDLDDELLELIEALIAMLSVANIDGDKVNSIMADFHRQINQDDIIIHFYETFLKAYNPQQRDMRGVYYTPASVVSYMVRSVDLILKDKLGIKEGLIDGNVKILDPATGTGTFLDQVIKFVHQNYKHKDNLEKWNEYVKENLLPRLFGFELMMAPYAVAHLKLGLELQETGYKFDCDKRLSIYLADTLGDTADDGEFIPGEFLSNEFYGAEKVKQKEDVLVVIGNPPYSVSSSNNSVFLEGNGKKGKARKEGIMDDYKKAVKSEKNIQPLSDDYIKFIRFAHWKIEKSGSGIIAFITNHAYINGLIHRGMREELLKTFDEIFVLDLHGNSNIGEKCPDGSPDKNVFDIKQGVAICFLIKTNKKKKGELALTKHCDFYGNRESKEEILKQTNIQKINWTELKDINHESKMGKFFFFSPQALKGIEEYSEGFSVVDIFKQNTSGFKTHRDHFAIDFQKETIVKKMEDFKSSSTDESISLKYDLKDNRDWSISQARDNLKSLNNWKANVQQCLYRPFDKRFCYFSTIAMDYPRPETMQHMLNGENLGLITMKGDRKPIDEFRHFFVTKYISEIHATDNAADTAYLFPLYLYKSSIQEINKINNEQTSLFNQSEEQTNIKSEVFQRKLNIKPVFWELVQSKYGNIEPERFFTYLYAVFHSPTYRERYKEFLKIDFPRLPLTSNKELFAQLSEIGQELVDLHLMKSDKLNDSPISFPVQGINAVDTVSFDGNKVWINGTQYFQGIEEQVWNFHIGGYQVLDKWLKDRKKGKYTLKTEDIEHYKKVYVASLVSH